MMGVLVNYQGAHMTTKQIILLALITGMLITALLLAVILGGLLAEQAQPTCMEDMACWDCRIEGNLICGINAPWFHNLPYPFDELAYWLVDTFVKEQRTWNAL